MQVTESGIWHSSPMLLPYYYGRLIADSGDGILVLDASSTIVYANSPASVLLQTEESLVGRSLPEVLPSLRETMTGAALECAIRERFPTSGEGILEAIPSENVPTSTPKPDRWLSLRTYPIEWGATLIVLRDTTLYRKTESLLRDALREQEQAHVFFEQIARTIPDILFIYDLATERNTFTNREITSVLGFTPEEIMAMPSGWVRDRLHPDDEEAFSAYRERRSRMSDGTYEEILYRLRHKDGSYRYLHGREAVLRRSTDGTPLLILGIARDVTVEQEQLHRQKALLAEAVERAERDALTGLYNRYAFDRYLSEAARRAQTNNERFAVILFDLDNFKFFNDAYGHTAGDNVLCRVADAIRQECLSGDLAARLGGDEFAIVAPGLTQEQAERKVQRLLENATHLSFQPERSQSIVPIRLSGGVAVLPDDTDGAQDAFDIADERLYRNKRTNRDLETQALRAELSKKSEGFATLDALVTAVDNKDRYTRRHTDDVVRYITLLAREMDFGSRETEELVIAALLHDVGKVAVSERILRQPSRLSEEEFAQIKRSVLVSVTLVGTAPDLLHALPAVRGHHERWDGTGYPDGVARENIPLPARMLAVADAFSALTTDRPYRRGIPSEAALAVLREGAGTQWDPLCVEAFVRSYSAVIDSFRAQNVPDSWK